MSTVPLVMQIAVTGREAIPAAMAEASAAVLTQSKVIESSYEEMATAAVASQKATALAALQARDAFGQMAGAVIAAQAATAEASAASGKKIEYSMMEARHSAMAFGEIAGVHVPRMVSMMLSHMQSVGPILASAFPVIGAIMLLTFLAEKIPAAIGHLGGLITGWTEKAKADYDDLIAENQKYVDALEKVVQGQEKVRLIGMTGVAKARAEYENVQVDLRRAQDEIPRLEARKNALQKEVDTVHLFRSDAEKKKAEEELKKAKEALDAKIIEVDELKGVRLPTAAREITVGAAGESIEQMKASSEARKNIGLAQFSVRIDQEKAMYQLGLTTANEEVAALVDLEEQKLAIQKKFFADQRSLALLQQKQDPGKVAGPKLTAINAEEVKAVAETEAAKQRLYMEANKENTRKEHDYTNLVRTEALKQQEAIDISLKQTTTTIIQLYHKRIEEAKKALQQEIELTKVNSDEQIRMATIAYEDRAGTDMRLLAAHKISLKQWHDDEIAALNTLEAEKMAALQRELSLYQRIGETEIVNQRRVEAQMTELSRETARKREMIDQQYAQKVMQAYQKIDAVVTRDLTAWLTGHQTFGSAVSNIWNMMTGNLLTNLLRQAEAEMVSLATHEAAATKSIFVTAKKAAADAYGAMAGIPIIGPELGAVAAAATFAAVMAFGSFEKGGVVPTSPTFAMLHKNEMVLPATLSSTIQDMAGAGGGANNTTKINFSPTVSAFNDKGIKQVLRSQARELSDIMRKQRRLGYLPVK